MMFLCLQWFVAHIQAIMQSPKYSALHSFANDKKKWSIAMEQDNRSNSTMEK